MKQKELVLDDIDYNIIYELQKNGRESYKNIAKKLGVSDGTVRLRTEKMVKSGYLRISASVDPLFFDHCLAALVGLTLEKSADKDLMPRIAGLDGVHAVMNVTGRYDLIVEVFVSSRIALRRFLVEDLPKVGGVKSTETYMFMDATGKWVPLSGGGSVLY